MENVPPTRSLSVSDNIRYFICFASFFAPMATLYFPFSDNICNIQDAVSATDNVLLIISLYLSVSIYIQYLEPPS